MLIENIISSVCLAFAVCTNIAVIDFYRSKPLGKQTLMDLLYVDFIFYHGTHQFLLCSYTLFLPRPMATHLALVISRLPHFFVLAMCLQMSIIAIGKFIHFYQQHLILEANLTDNQIVTRIRMTTMVIIGITETVAVYWGHVYREFEYLSDGACYQNRCDKGQVAAVFIILALILNGSLSLSICIKGRKMKGKVLDVSIVDQQQQQSYSSSDNNKDKMMKTLLSLFLISLYGSAMILLMTQGKEVLLSEAEVIRSIGLISICIVIPSAVLMAKKKYRVHIAKRFYHLKEKLNNVSSNSNIEHIKDEKNPETAMQVKCSSVCSNVPM